MGRRDPDRAGIRADERLLQGGLEGLRRLLDTEDIRQLGLLYSQLQDHGYLERLVDIFTDDAIYVEPAEQTDANRFSPGERYAKRYEINLIRCIFCGFCQEVCPEEAIVMSQEFELTFTRQEDAIFGKDKLLVPAEQLKDRLEFLRKNR